MFAHLRIFFSFIAILAGVFTSPAYSNPIASLPDSKVASERAAEPAAPQETCLSRPGKSANAGQRWVYHTEGNRKCWFQSAEQPRLEKGVRYRSAKPSVAASAESESMQPKPKRVEDARAELLPLRPETPQARPSAPGLDVVAAAPVQSADRASLLTRELDRLEPDNGAGRRLDADSSLTHAPPQRVASQTALVADTPPVHSTSETLDDKPGLPATWIAVFLMALGFISILGSNRAVRDMVTLRHKRAKV
jgi:hypothetical protein